MNTIKTLMFLALITLSIKASAHTKIPSDDLESVTKQIKSFLKHSNLKIYNTITVTIKFKLGENNKIIMLSNNSKNCKISKFIKERLSLKKLHLSKENNYIFYSIPVRFLSTIY